MTIAKEKKADEIAKLRADRNYWKKRFDDYAGPYSEAANEVLTLREQLKEKSQALRKFGNHHRKCSLRNDRRRPCDCGYLKAIS